MRIHLFACSVAVVLGAAGCSIHPLPDDFPRASTVAIVQQIRCEAHDAVERLRRDNKAVYDRENLKDAAIGYRFHFTITETNTAGAGAAFRLPLTHGTFSLGIDAGSEKERVGEREFTIVENFKDLKGITCEEGHRATSENFRYPITGKIGLEETIDTFASLAGLIRASKEENGDEAGEAGGGGKKGVRSSGGRKRDKKESEKNKRDKNKGGKTADFTDSLTFTTTITGGLNPKIELDPLGSGFELTEAEANLAGERKDKHEVVVALYLPRSKGDIAKERRMMEMVVPFSSVIRGLGEPLSPAEYARQKALEALDRQRELSTERRILERLR